MELDKIERDESGALIVNDSNGFTTRRNQKKLALDKENRISSLESKVLELEKQIKRIIKNDS